MSRAFIQKRLPFKPTDIGGCQMWLDGADSSTLTLSGSIVTQWRDKSGSGNNATPVNTGPTLVQNVKNSLPGLSFSGGNMMKCGAFLTSTSFSAFIIVNNTSGTKVSMGVWKVQYGSYIITDVEIKVGTENSSAYSNTSITIPDFTTTHMYAVTLSSSSAPGSSFTYNGSFDGSNTVITGTSSSGNAATCAQEVSIGGLMENNSPQYMMTGYIHEVIFFSNALTSIQRQQVESYLAQKWGMRQQLPQGHPGTRGIVFPSDPVNLLVRVPYQFIFVPTSIGGCQLWYDAMDATTITQSGGLVSQLRDKSGNNRHISQATTGNQPSYANNTLTFNGSQYLTNTISSGISGNIFTGYIIYKPNSTSGNQRALFIIDNSSWIMIDNNQVAENANGIGAYIGTTISTITPTIVAVTSASTYSLNGNTFSNITNGYNQGNPTSINLGSGTSGGVPFNGSIYEVLVYNFVLSLSQHYQVTGYLAWKWGTQATLPITNTYKNASPTITNQFGISRPPNVLPIPPITISARSRSVIQVLISSGLLVRYRMNESSGSTVIDSVAGNNITIGGSPSRVSTSYGTYTGFALSIQNSTQNGYITLPANMVVGAHSITSWVYFTGLPTGRETVWVGWGSGCKGENHAFYNNNASISIIYGGPSCIYSLNFLDNNTAIVSPQLNTWYFCVTTWDGTNTWKTYCYSPTTPYAFTFSYGMNAVTAGGVFAIGISNNLNAQFGGTGYGGYIGEVRFYNRVLTAAEVASIYAGTG